MWRRFPDLSKVETFYLQITVGKKRYFVQQTRKGWVLGPQIRHNDDHITVGLRDEGDEKELVQVHRKVNGVEVWRHTQDSMTKELQGFWDTNTEVIDPITLREPKTYIVSLHRVNVCFNLMMTLIGVGYFLLARFFFPLRVKRINDRTLIVDLHIAQERIVRFMSPLRYPMILTSRILTGIPPQVYYSVAKRVSKFFLINPKNLNNLQSDIGFLISAKRVGVVTSNDNGELRHLPLSSLVDLYESVERSLPFGKLNEITEGGEPGFNFEFKIPEKP